MTTALTAPETTPWYDRRGARWSALAVIAVGVLLAVVGVFGFVTARQANDDAAPTRAQLTVVEQEYATLTQQHDDAVAQATEARAAASAIDEKVAAVDSAIVTVDTQYGIVVDAQNAIADCGNNTTMSDAAMLACMSGPYETYKTEAARFADDVSALKAATSALEEANQ
jgi:hypothetical protein